MRRSRRSARPRARSGCSATSPRSATTRCRSTSARRSTPTTRCGPGRTRRRSSSRCQRQRRNTGGRARGRRVRPAASPHLGGGGDMKRTLVAAAAAFGLCVATAQADYTPGIPPAVDPGTPVFAGLADPVPAEPAALTPGKSRLEAIYEADLAAGGTSFWIDRLLERPFLSNQDSYLYTRGRALYMYTHTAGTLGFAGGYAYRERPTGANQSLFTVAISGATLSEVTAQRRQYPSHWASTHAATGLNVTQRKFITYNNTAVSVIAVTNTGTETTTRTITASSPVATIAARLGTELTGSVKARWGLTTLTPRLSGDGFGVTGTALTRTITLEPGATATFKVQLGMIAAELPASDPEYERYRGYDPETAFRT